jgi:hypothetical protein
MAIADDLLTLARHLATTDPQQAWLGRSISTAYYALFQLLVQEAALGWTGSTEARLGLERTFRHDLMKEVSRSVAAGSWKGWTTPRLAVPAELRDVAEVFWSLQEARHLADYSNEKYWRQTEVGDTVKLAGTAFENWRKIAGTPVAEEYLLSLMIGKKRE